MIRYKWTDGTNKGYAFEAPSRAIVINDKASKDYDFNKPTFVCHDFSPKGEVKIEGQIVKPLAGVIFDLYISD